MKISKLKIENFRGIREMVLDLHPKMNVFIGINGSGKSSVLDAVGHLLEPVEKILTNYSENVIANRKYDFPISDVNNDARCSQLEITMARNKEQDISWTLVTPPPLFQDAQKPFKSGMQDLSERIPELHDFFLSGNHGRNIGVLVYYRVMRSVEDVPINAWSNRSFIFTDAFREAFSSKTDFREFFEWFRNREDLENEELAEGESHPDPSLEAVRKAIENFIGDSIKDVKIRRRDPLRMVANKHGKEFRIEQFSEGEKSLLALIGDLARRLAIANAPEAGNPLAGEAVVLIDEVDLHLHPQWQRMILPRMMKTFPNCQFIVSTHSPQILGEVPSEHVTILSEGENGIEARKPDYEVYGQTADVILADIMDTPKRKKEVESKLKELFSAIESGDLPKARNIKSVLESQAKDIPEYAKIEILIHRKEKLGK